MRFWLLLSTFWVLKVRFLKNVLDKKFFIQKGRVNLLHCSLGEQTARSPFQYKLTAPLQKRLHQFATGFANFGMRWKRKKTDFRYINSLNGKYLVRIRLQETVKHMELEAKLHFLNNCTIWSDRYDNYLKVQVLCWCVKKVPLTFWVIPIVVSKTNFFLQQINL